MAQRGLGAGKRARNVDANIRPWAEASRAPNAGSRERISLLRHRAAAEGRRPAQGVYAHPRRLGRRAERRKSARGREATCYWWPRCWWYVPDAISQDVFGAISVSGVVHACPAAKAPVLRVAQRLWRTRRGPPRWWPVVSWHLLSPQRSRPQPGLQRLPRRGP